MPEVCLVYAWWMSEVCLVDVEGMPNDVSDRSQGASDK